MLERENDMRLITRSDFDGLACGALLKEAGIKPKKYGVRLDSGDLAYLSKAVYKMLDEAGFGDAIISASSDLDEYLIQSLKNQGATINLWGVGTNLITSKDNPAFGGVYKLAAVKTSEDEGFVPKIKLSENSEKITNPGNKTIYRIYDKNTGKMRADLICLADETFNEEEDMIIFDPIETWKKTKIKGGTYTMKELLVPIFIKGECVYESPSVMEIADYCRKEKDTLWEESKRLFYPQKVYVDLSDELYSVKRQLLHEMSMA
jgi:nicotinate phosphoribosyltransferase